MAEITYCQCPSNCGGLSLVRLGITTVCGCCKREVRNV